MIRHASILGCCLLGAVNLLAQQTVTIKGIVTDAASGVPVANATVSLRPGISNADLDTVTASGAGTFALTVPESGTYGVAASADGYREQVNRGIKVGDAEFEPGASAVEHKAELKLERSSLLTGLIRDGDSRQPISRVVVRAIRLWWWRGQRRAEEGPIVFTDEDGVFRFEGLPPADYVLMFGNTTNYEPFSTDRWKAYPMRVWPAGDPESAVLLLVRSGTQLNVGAIDYSKIIAPRIHAPACESQTRTSLTIEQNIAGAWYRLSRTEGSICTELRPIPALSRGLYRLHFLTTSSVSVGIEEMRIRDGEDSEAKVKLLPLASATGKVTCECEKPPEPGSHPITMDLAGIEFAMTMELTDDATSQAVVPGEVHVSVRSVPDGFVMKRLLVDGQEAGEPVSVHSGTVFEVVLSDKPASIAGTVARDKPVTKDHVVIAKWPGPAGSNYVPFVAADPDAKGYFAAGKLAPGKYRVTAVGPEQWERREMPNAVAEWLAMADDIVLGPGEMKTIRIEAKLP